METRSTRGRRGPTPSIAPDDAPPQVQTRRTTRSTRQTANQSADRPASAGAAEDAAPDHQAAESEPASKEPAEAESTNVRGSLASTPARRGAPKGPPLSIAQSIPSRHSRQEDGSDDAGGDDDDDDDSDHFEDAGTGESQRPLNGSEPGGAIGGSDVQEPDKQADAAKDMEAARRQVRHRCLIDLALTSYELMSLLRKPEANSLVYDGLLSVKRETFLAVRKIFESSAGYPFADGGWINGLEGNTPETVRVAKTVLVFANLVTALDWIERTLSQTLDPLYALEGLDRAFPRAFILPGHKSTPYDKLALDIRTARWIETVAASRSTADLREITATVFCEAVGNTKEYAASDWSELFSHGPYRSLGGLRSQILTDACSERVAHIFSKRSLMERSVRGPVNLAELREEYPLREVLMGLREWLLCIYSASASRFEQTPRDLRALQLGIRSGHHVENDSASVAESQPESQRTVVRMPGDERSMFKNPIDLTLLHQNNANEDDDDFETDPRFVANGKRPATQPSPSLSKRRRPGRMAPPLLPSASPSALSSSPMPDIAAVQRNKALALQQARSQNPTSYKQRHPWTEHDTSLLIQLVSERSASWSSIERSDGHRFQRPRDAQAYRDRARNIKVDFLIANSPLPMGFDHVHLGSKEIKKAIKYNKNPWREEKDIDDEGKPCRTDMQDAPPELIQMYMS